MSKLFDPSTNRRTLKPLAWATAVGMYIVLVMGATVTNTGSAEGCGRSWPLCHGELIPEFAVSTMIEFSHRAVTGIETMLVLALAFGAWRAYRRNHEIRVLVVLLVGTLFLQAGMGAWAVLYPQNPLVLALHFGISLAAFASALLVATSVGESEVTRQLRNRPVSPGYRRTAWAALVFMLIVVYLGAYVRHAGLNMGCSGWPLCNGEVLPSLGYPTGIVFAHRFAALLAVLFLFGLAGRAWGFRKDRPDVAGASIVAVVLILAQSLTGAVVVSTGMVLFSALLHAGVMALLFGSVSYLCLRVLPQTVESETTERPMPSVSVPAGSAR